LLQRFENVMKTVLYTYYYHYCLS